MKTMVRRMKSRERVFRIRFRAMGRWGGGDQEEYGQGRGL